MDNAGESMMTDVNMADDCVMDVGAEEVAVFELCTERDGVGRYTLLNRRKGLRLTATGGGDFGAPGNQKDPLAVSAHGSHGQKT